ncbi:hypothetical protein PBAL39_16686 [Pedobacter sp. BAL39]|uniref:hypothetical protein n=1 Tax=Pedobacter sp. BAL39 TaxID=391596 RepID=UPI000155A162|nr:hypothetical protein [Pedobacter sp. BAL39]EDM35137.1 hypothetical protein PBAL39_16686 [Pedobacter sp. BAL39]
MAKAIKVLKCPQCGSTAKTEIKPDFFRCSNCQTEYFLDNDDVTINYNHNYTHHHPSSNPEQNAKNVKILAIGIALVFITILTIVITKSSTSSSPAPSYTVAESPRPAEKEIFSISRYNAQPILATPTAAPILIVVEDRSYNGNESKKRDGIYLTFYDDKAKEKLGEEKVGDDDVSGSDVQIRNFSDGNTYVIVSKNKLFVVDKGRLKLNDAGKSFFSAQPELQVGVATIEFVYSDAGDGLVLLTNEGKNFYYYPLIQKLYTKDQYYDARTGFNTLLPGARDKETYLFTSESSDFPEERIQLIKIKYKDNGAGPKDVTDRLSWGKNYGGSGIFTERSPYRKELLGGYERERGRVTSWKDLTPGRTYFSPKVISETNGTILIMIKADANPASPYKLQQLNSETGAINWTLDLAKGERPDKALAFSGGYFVVTDSSKGMIVDQKGKITYTYKFD